MKHVYIAHDSTIFDNVTISSGAKIGGHCIIEQESNIGLNAALHQFTHVGENCMIGASAFVKGEAKANTKYAGVPAREIGSNIR
jgi:UDP-N-acetylglucosamine acyltransferase